MIKYDLSNCIIVSYLDSYLYCFHLNAHKVEWKNSLSITLGLNSPKMVWGEGNGEETGQKKSLQWSFDGKDLRIYYSSWIKQPLSLSFLPPGLSVLEIDNISTLNIFALF